MTPIAGEVTSALIRALGTDDAVDGSTRRRAEYSSDASNYRVVPQVVVFPRHVDDVLAVHATCRELGVPLTSRGAGTSVAGNAIGPGVVLDFSRHLNGVLELDPGSRTAAVQPGVVLDALQSAAAPHGLRFGPDPSTHARCTLGGMIGNDACGSHALVFGRTSDNVLALDVLDGTGRRFGTDAPPTDLLDGLTTVAATHLATIRTSFGTFDRQASGYALQHLLPERNREAASGLSGKRLAGLLTGSEGTLVTLLSATVRLVQAPAVTTLVVLGYPDLAAAADATPALLRHRPLALEGIERPVVELLRSRGRAADGLPPGDGTLLVELGGDSTAESQAAARALVADAGDAVGSLVVTDPVRAHALWRIRESGAGLAGRTVDNRPAWPGWEDAAVPVDRLGAYLRDFRLLLDDFDLDGLQYGHLGDGCMHTRIDFPLTEPGGIDRTVEFLTAAAHLVAGHGGSLSGEHSDGRARGALLPIMYPPAALAAFGQVKALFDPDDLLNPGVLVRPAPLDADLRVPAARATASIGGGRRSALPGLAFPDDGDLTAAVHRCVGVGACRADTNAVMCPSYVATRDEKDSTRGRARVLQEMANGGLVAGGWSSGEVLESLDLCLSCKGCAVDCPAGVDMASYKAEFTDRHFRGRIRPRSHYTLGRLAVWARLASRVPLATNRAMRTAGLARLAKAAAGVDRRRSLPSFAPETFRGWFSRRNVVPAAPEGDPVVLWVDTFTEYFDPGVGRAAIAVLEHLGFRVAIPAEPVCCGLTWLSTGQLAGARRQLLRSLTAIDEAAARLDATAPHRVPVVGLEPSCTALLRDDAARLLPNDKRAVVLHDRVFTLAGLIRAHRPDWQPPAGATAAAVVQEHCHQHASTGFTADKALLEATGLEPTVLSGCCGLAGNFGVEKGHHDVSVAIAEHALLPALKEAPAGTTVPVADGFSCRTQAEQLAGIRPRHLAQILAASLVPPAG